MKLNEYGRVVLLNLENNGIIRPVTITEFDFKSYEDALRSTISGNHVQGIYYQTETGVGSFSLKTGFYLYSKVLDDDPSRYTIVRIDQLGIHPPPWSELSPSKWKQLQPLERVERNKIVCQQTTYSVNTQRSILGNTTAQGSGHHIIYHWYRKTTSFHSYASGELPGALCYDANLIEWYVKDMAGDLGSAIGVLNVRS